MKHIIFILAIATFALTLSAEDNDKGVHLFILSGQSNMDGLNPRNSFIPAVEAAFGKENVIVVKDARGGTPIRSWYMTSPPAKGDQSKKTGRLYDRLMAKVKPAIQGKTFKSVTFVWMQGERDAKEKRSDVYAASFKGLLEQIKKDLNIKTLNVVIGRLSDHDMENKVFGHWTKMRDLQVKLAEDDPNGVWVDTDDLNNKTKNGKSWDDLHYTQKGYKILGERFAEKAIELINKQ